MLLLHRSTIPLPLPVGVLLQRNDELGLAGVAYALPSILGACLDLSV